MTTRGLALRSLRACIAVTIFVMALPAGGPDVWAAETLPADSLEKCFAEPPPEARSKCYWWWINGNVTKAAITRDLEEMKAKGMGGALVFDAGGPAGPTPAGPAYMSDPWRELFLHAVKEADRLGLTLSLSIQSGWNLGGPIVKPEEAAKHLVWSQATVKGPAKIDMKLPSPKVVGGFYRDIAVLAYRMEAQAAARADALTVALSASSEQKTHPASDALTGGEKFWVSEGSNPGDGPTTKKPEWLQFSLSQPHEADCLTLQGRPKYGPRECELQASDDGKTFRTVKVFAVADGKTVTVKFEPLAARYFRVVIRGAFDKGEATDKPRNVQVSEVSILRNGRKIWGQEKGRAKPIRMLEMKSGYHEMGGSAPDTSVLLQDDPDVPGEQDVMARDVIDITDRLDKDGQLKWDAPEGQWQVLRFGYTYSGARVSTCSPGWNGMALDYLDTAALKSYWRQAVAPIIADAGPLAGKSLKYLHTDSWELGGMNWTAEFAGEFRRRRGYDMLPYLPVLAGRIVDSRSVSNRFLNDFRKTIGDCIAENHYQVFAELAHKHNMGIHPESGGPHGAPVDALKCLGRSDVSMMEFWARAKTHRVRDEDRLFVKQAASAAHIYGTKIVSAEAFTTIAPHWQENLADNLKPTFDQEACEGLNQVVIHQFTCSPAEMGVPGQEYFAGTHFNPQVTWWRHAGAFVAYLNRCQAMLQRGVFVADVCYYYGDHVPNFVQLKKSDPAKILPGYDYDCVNAEVLLTRAAARDGRLAIGDMSYRVLVLPDRTAMPVEVLAKIRELVQGGVTVIGPRVQTDTGLKDYPRCDERIKTLAAELWDDAAAEKNKGRKVGAGRVVWGRSAREMLAADGVTQDFEYTAQADAFLDYIHRRDGEAEIYFVVNRNDRWEDANAIFRVSGKQPELWDALTGEIRPAGAFSQNGGRTTVPLRLPPFGSVFVVFRQPIAPDAAGREARNYAELSHPEELAGPWTVKFDPRWGGPASVEFPQLSNWIQHADAGVKYYSGTATYCRKFDLSDELRKEGRKLVLDLGTVKNIAEVRLNGKNLGVVWAFPFRVDITAAARPTGNELEIDVTNFWPNRQIGDTLLPEGKRFTRTTVKPPKDGKLLDSGLLGPVKVWAAN